MTPERALEIACAVLERHPARVHAWRDEPAVPPSNGRRLSPGERQEVADLIESGWTNAAIAAELSVSERSVERHRARLLREDVAWAVERARVENLATFRRQNEGADHDRNV